MFYVTMTDKFLSGWGLAKGKISKVVIECETLDMAKKIYKHVGERNEMKNVNITSRKPYYTSKKYHVSLKTSEECRWWFEEEGEEK